MTFWGVMLPFFGTALGAMPVLFLRPRSERSFGAALDGLAAGIMTAASFFSLLLPALELSSSLERLSFLPAAVGLVCGMLFLPAADAAALRLRRCGVDGRTSPWSPTSKMIFAVTLHNLPEGMAVGVAFALFLSGGADGAAGAFALSLGVALQNLPEGSIISMPLYAEGMSRRRAFFYGVLSGVIEPVGALAALLAVGSVAAMMPYMLSFAAGAMFFVVLCELVPRMAESAGETVSAVSFAAGFALMMALDVALG